MAKALREGVGALDHQPAAEAANQAHFEAVVLRDSRILVVCDRAIAEVRPAQVGIPGYVRIGLIELDTARQVRAARAGVTDFEARIGSQFALNRKAPRLHR